MSEKLFYKDEYDNNKFIDATHDDFIIAKGGDGTLLKAINKFKHLKKPFFGIGAGTLNFLMNKKDKISKNVKFKKFRLIKVKVTFTEKIDKGFTLNGNNILETIKTEEYQAFNDVFISEENGWIDFDCKDKDNILGKFKGSGLIISTSQGSTGINKNNGGVILPLSSENWSVTGDKTNRPIEYVLNNKKIKINLKSRGSINLFIDGNNNKIENISYLEVSKGKIIEVIFNNYKSFKKKRIL